MRIVAEGAVGFGIMTIDAVDRFFLNLMAHGADLSLATRCSNGVFLDMEVMTGHTGEIFRGVPTRSPIAMCRAFVTTKTGIVLLHGRTRPERAIAHVRLDLGGPTGMPRA